jgi:ferredoxin
MLRNIITIDEDKCDGCGLCVKGCHEGALAIIDGKAKLVSDTYCDGLGACLGECPQGAITITQREAKAFDEAAVEQRQRELGLPVGVHNAPPAAAPAHHEHGHSGGCPGSAMRSFAPLAPPRATVTPATHGHTHAAGSPCGCPGSAAQNLAPQTPATAAPRAGMTESQLGHWPVQLRLLNPAAPFLHDADLLLCADCAPFTIPDFHSRYLTGRAVAIGCPKLDQMGESIERLAAIIAEAKPRRITVLRMEVPCCGGLAQAAFKARELAGVNVPIDVHVAGIRGGISVM